MHFRRLIRLRLRSSVLSAIGVLLCAWGAALLCILFHGKNDGAWVPVGFLAIIVIVALRCGLIAGALGSAVSALIFACFLYQPLGHVSVQDPSARMNLGWLVLGGLACSYLLAPSELKRHQ